MGHEKNTWESRVGRSERMWTHVAYVFACVEIDVKNVAISGQRLKDGEDAHTFTAPARARHEAPSEVVNEEPSKAHLLVIVPCEAVHAVNLGDIGGHAGHDDNLKVASQI